MPLKNNTLFRKTRCGELWFRIGCCDTRKIWLVAWIRQKGRLWDESVRDKYLYCYNSKAQYLFHHVHRCCWPKSRSNSMFITLSMQSEVVFWPSYWRTFLWLWVRVRVHFWIVGKLIRVPNQNPIKLHVKLSNKIRCLDVDWQLNFLTSIACSLSEYFLLYADYYLNNNSQLRSHLSHHLNT